MNPPAPHTEWRHNTSLDHTQFEFFDLFVDAVYQSIWLERDRLHGTWQLVAFDTGKSYRSPTETTMEAVKQHFTTYMAINKLEGKR